jgi:hypothetical protein
VKQTKVTPGHQNLKDEHRQIQSSPQDTSRANFIHFPIVTTYFSNIHHNITFHLLPSVPNGPQLKGFVQNGLAVPPIL